MLALAQGHAREQALAHNRVVTWVHTGLAALVFAAVLVLVLLFSGCAHVPQDVQDDVHLLSVNVPRLLELSQSNNVADVDSRAAWQRAAAAVKDHITKLDQRIQAGKGE